MSTSGRLAICALAALLLVFLLRPFQELPLDWRIRGNREHGTRLPFVEGVEEWGVSPDRVAYFGASDRPDDRTQQWRHRVDADVQVLAAFGPVKLKFKATQPKNALIDPDTGTRRTSADGVTGIFEVFDGKEWVTRDRIELEPTVTSWRDVVVEIPRGSARAALAWTPRKSMEGDSVLVAFEPPEARVLGVPLVVIKRLGELLILTSVAFLLSFALQRLLALVDRISTVPPARVVPHERGSLGLRHLLLAGVIVGAPLLLAFAVAPWLEAATTPVVIEWPEPEGARVEVFFGSAPDDHVPAVRLASGAWGAELPPRPSYRIALELPAAAAEAGSTLGTITLIDSRDASDRIRIPRERLRLATAGIAHAGGSDRSTSRPTARLEYPDEIPIGRMSHGEKIRVVWFGGACALALLMLGFRLVVRRATTDTVRTPVAPGILPLVIAGLVAAVWIVVWVLSAPAIVTPDTMTYLKKGEAIARLGRFDTGYTAGELTRTPGYPAFLAVVLKLFGRDLTPIVIAQGLLYAFGLFFVAASLRFWIRTGWLILGMLLGAVSLSHLHLARVMISESVFVSLCLIALGCFFFARASARPWSLYWVLAFAIATAAATCTRLVGVGLLAVPAVTWLSGAVALWKSGATKGARFANIARYSLPYVLVVAVLLAAVLGWSYRNHRSRGYFGFAAMVSLSNLQGEIFAGTMDPRVLIPEGIYPRFVRERSANRYEWTSWYIYRHLYDRAIAEGVGTRALIKHVEDDYDALYRASNATMPLRGRLVKFLRAAWWNLGPMTRDFSGSWTIGLGRYWLLWMSHPQAREAQLSYERDSHIPMATRDAPLTGMLELYHGYAARYPEVHWILLGLSVAGALLMLWRGEPVLAGPFLLVAANYALLTWLRQHEVRYMIVMDVFCILQIVVALGWRRAIGRSGAETHFRPTNSHPS